MGSGGAKRALVNAKTKDEFQFGYSRAVRHGDQVRVAGTAGPREDGSVISDDVEQMRRALAVLGTSDEKR